MEFLLLVIAILLLYILAPVVSIFVIVKHLITGDWKLAKVWFYATAFEIDKLGNFMGAPLFNEVLIKTGGYKFGHRNETISSVLGKNYRDGTLTKVGNGIRWILDKIDENHCLNSIDDSITNTRK